MRVSPPNTMRSNRPIATHRREEAAAEPHVVDQSQGDRAEQEDAGAVDQVNMIAGQASDRQLVDLLESLQQHERPAEREREVKREEPPETGAERQRAESLKPSQIDLSSAVDAVEHVGQFAVGLEQTVAPEKLGRPAQVACSFRFPREAASRRSPSVVKPRETIGSIISSTSLR